MLVKGVFRKAKSQDGCTLTIARNSFFLEPIWAMPAAGFAAVAALEEKLRSEDVVTIFQVVIFAFDELWGINHEQHLTTDDIELN